MNTGAASQAASSLGTFGLHQMPAAGTQAQHLSAGGYLEALGCRLFGFNTFRTSRISSAFFQKERAI